MRAPPLLVLLAIVLLAAACGGGSDKTSPTPAPTSTGPLVTTTPPVTPGDTAANPTATPCEFFPLNINRIKIADDFTATVAHGLNGRWSPNGAYFSFVVPVGSQSCDQGLVVDQAISLQRIANAPGNVMDWDWDPSSAAVVVAVASPTDPKPTDAATYIPIPVGPPVTILTGEVTAVAWSPAESSIAYGMGDSGDVGVYDIAANQATTVATLLPSGTTGGIRAGSLKWSPNGDRFAAVSAETDSKGNPTAYHLYTVSLPDGTASEIASGPNPITEQWSPDGQILLYEVAAPTSSELFVATATGANTPQKIADGAEAAFSPDGSLIAYVSDWCGAFNISTIRPSGNGDTVIAPPESRGVQLQPTWSPDGSLIAFHADATYTVHPDGSSLTRIGDPLEALSFSPDGTFLTGQTIGGRDFCTG